MIPIRKIEMVAMKMLSKEWYEKQYSGKEERVGWNIGRAHPGLVEMLDGGYLRRGRVLVPGCGLGYDAILLAERGFEVVAFDFSVNAIRRANKKARAKRKLKGTLEFVVEDIYKLPDSYRNGFDYVVEIGNFQAMSVKERREYVGVMRGVLVSSGRCVVLCKKYPPLTPGPKGIRKASLRKYFSDGFVVESIELVLMYRDKAPRDGFRLVARKSK